MFYASGGQGALFEKYCPPGLPAKTSYYFLRKVLLPSVPSPEVGILPE
jgi:hypothetical protein